MADDKYSGVDIRAEVILLTRNIKIQGINGRFRQRGIMTEEPWGGRVVTGDSMEFIYNAEGEMELFIRQGQVFLDSVEIRNCSHQDTYNPALHFDQASANSSVTNSSIHSGLGWGVYIETSKEIYMDHNVIYDFRPVGLAVDFSQDVMITNNFLMKVVERDTLEADNYVDKASGFALCSIYSSIATCTNMTANYNTAVGTARSGFWAPTHNCGEENTNFKGNLAHSIAG